VRPEGGGERGRVRTALVRRVERVRGGCGKGGGGRRKKGEGEGRSGEGVQE